MSKKTEFAHENSPVVNIIAFRKITIQAWIAIIVNYTHRDYRVGRTGHPAFPSLEPIVPY